MCQEKTLKTNDFLKSFMNFNWYKINSFVFFIFSFGFLLNLFCSVYAINKDVNNAINKGISTVVIDAGHGGEDPGALGKIHKEKDITLAIALKLGNCIQDNYPGIKVIFTRTTDVFIPLHERAEIANKNHADLFISIHANASKKTEVFGMETYAMGLHTNEKNLEVAKKENSVIVLEKDYSIHYEGYDPNSPESFIIFSLMQNTYLAQSLDFAANIQQQAKEVAKRYDRGVKQAGFLVLWKTSMPSVLVEVGYITNPDEEKYLASEEGQNEIAQSICKAFGDYKQKIEGNLNITSIERNENANLISNQTNNSNGNDTVIFKVQVFSLPRLLPSDAEEIKKCKKRLNISKVDVIFSNNYYKYTVGESDNYADIQKFANEVKKVYPDAFIIAIKGGNVIPLSTALNQ